MKNFAMLGRWHVHADGYANEINRIPGCRVVKDTDDVMIIENGGVIIRVPANSINIYKRDVQGVIVMRVEEGNEIVSIERVAAEEENEA